jgi:hypothetical protein
VGFRLAIRLIEAKLLGLLLLEVLAGTAAVGLLVTEFSALIAFQFFPIDDFRPVFFTLLATGVAVVFVVSTYKSLWSEIEEPCDKPLREPLRRWPELDNVVREQARELNRRAPHSAAFVLSPMAWRRFGCDPARHWGRRELIIPVSLLEIWPVMSLRCQVGHALVRRRLNALLFFAVRKAVIRLRGARLNRSMWLPLPPQRVLLAYAKLIAAWNGMADIEADARLARVLGGSAVASWIGQTQFGAMVAPNCLRYIIEPAAESGLRLPIAATCAAFHGLMAPGWSATVESERVKAQQSKPANPVFMPLLVRLAALTDGPARLYDPRPAHTLLPDLDSLEERLLRREASFASRNFRRAGVEELGPVVLSAMRADVVRNTDLFKGRSVADLPDLTRQIPALAEAYRPDPRYALGLSQRRACIPGLLTAFLATELERKGWNPKYAVGVGLMLERDGRTLVPQLLIAGLGKGALTREAFLESVQWDDGSEQSASAPAG